MNYCHYGYIALSLLFTSAVSATKTDLSHYFSLYDKDAPGCAVGVIQPDKLADQVYFGQSNIRYQIPIDNQTVFDIGSVSKHMTAYVIFSLESEGVLSRNQTLADFYKGGPDWFNQVTLLHLMNHQSGIPDYLNDSKTGLYFLQRFQKNTAEINNLLWGTMIDKTYLFSEIVDYSKALQSPVFAPGNSVSYSNTGYVLLADIIEKVTDNTFEKEIENRIFIPLKMTKSQASTVDNFIIDWKATGYFLDKKGNYAYRHSMLVTQGDGGIQSTLPDMAKWVAHLITAKYDDKARTALLNYKKSEYPRFTPYSGSYEFKMGDSTYAHGLIANELYNGDFYSHSGRSTDGMVTELWFSPTRKVGYLQMCNYMYLKMAPIKPMVQHYGQGIE